MKNKKGFTLVELLAVIVILAILVTIAVPSTMGVSKKLKENMYCSKIDSIETSAAQYGEDRKDSFGGTYTDADGAHPSTNIRVSELVDKGYLKKDHNTDPIIEDPRDSKSTDLYNMEFTIYVKYNRVYVHFNDAVWDICKK